MNCQIDFSYIIKVHVCIKQLIGGDFVAVEYR